MESHKQWGNRLQIPLYSGSHPLICSNVATLQIYPLYMPSLYFKIDTILIPFFFPSSYWRMFTGRFIFPWFYNNEPCKKYFIIRHISDIFSSVIFHCYHSYFLIDIIYASFFCRDLKGYRDDTPYNCSRKSQDSIVAYLPASATTHRYAPILHRKRH